MVRELNRRFTIGHPSDQLAEAGVLVRQMDSLNTGDAMWGGAAIGDGAFDDRLAASIVNARLPHMFSTSAVGLVLAPDALQQERSSIWCMYERDGNSMGQGEHGCADTRRFAGDQLKAMLERHEQTLHWHTLCLWGEPDAADRSGCQYNEIVLQSERFQAALPAVVQAVFLPTNAIVHHSEGDAPRAASVRDAFARAFGVTLPLLSYDVGEARKGHAPFALLLAHTGAPSTGHASVNARACESMLRDEQSKFHRMWGREGWRLSAPPRAGGRDSCWGGSSSAAEHEYFASVLAADQCDRNWFEGASGALGRPSARADFPERDAPALLGFDETIDAYCGEQVGGRPYDASGDWNSQLAHKCVEASLNILRLLSGREPWTMCQNLRWMLCAVRGRLPRQRERELRFATSPASLEWQWFDDPAASGSWWMEPHDTHYAVSDVYFAEVAILNAICANSGELFAVARGQAFTCEFDQSGFANLRRALTGG